MADEQDQAEALDADRFDAWERGGEEQELGDYPPDRLMGANQYGAVPSEEEIDEPLEERVSREEPEPLLEALEHPDRGPVDPDDVALLEGTLVEPVEAADDPVLDADAVSQQDLAPEEAAIHIEPDTALPGGIEP